MIEVIYDDWLSVELEWPNEPWFNGEFYLAPPLGPTGTIHELTE